MKCSVTRALMPPLARRHAMEILRTKAKGSLGLGLGLGLGMWSGLLLAFCEVLGADAAM